MTLRITTDVTVLARELEQELQQLIQRMDLLFAPAEPVPAEPVPAEPVPAEPVPAELIAPVLSSCVAPSEPGYSLYQCPFCGIERKRIGAHRRWCKRATPEQRELFLLTGSFHFGTRDLFHLLALAKAGNHIRGNDYVLWLSHRRRSLYQQALSIEDQEGRTLYRDEDGVLREPDGRLARDVILGPADAKHMGLLLAGWDEDH